MGNITSEQEKLYNTLEPELKPLYRNYFVNLNREKKIIEDIVNQMKENDSKVIESILIREEREKMQIKLYRKRSSYKKNKNEEIEKKYKEILDRDLLDFSRRTTRPTTESSSSSSASASSHVRPRTATPTRPTESSSSSSASASPHVRPRTATPTRPTESSSSSSASASSHVRPRTASASSHVRPRTATPTRSTTSSSSSSTLVSPHVRSSSPTATRPVPSSSSSSESSLPVSSTSASVSASSSALPVSSTSVSGTASSSALPYVSSSLPSIIKNADEILEEIVSYRERSGKGTSATPIDKMQTEEMKKLMGSDDEYYTQMVQMEDKKPIFNHYGSYIKKEPLKFETEIRSDRIVVYSCSDFHGDIDLLIYTLRECCNVIVPIEGAKPELTSEGYDKNVRYELEVDLLNPRARYVPSLSYKWNEKNEYIQAGYEVYVVIAGDILDGYRGGNTEHYYPQVEYKMYKFINAINNGHRRIIKLLGNHELYNMDKNFSGEFTRYMFPRDVENPRKPYCTVDGRTYTRIEFFNYPNPGFYEIMKDGAGILVKINNLIFVHGAVVARSFLWYKYINIILNHGNERRLSDGRTIIQVFLNYLNEDPNGPLWNRMLGDTTDSTMRVTNTAKKDNFCHRVIQILDTFNSDAPEPKIALPDLKIIIGHCPQNFIGISEQNKTFSEKILPSRDISGNVRTTTFRHHRRNVKITSARENRTHEEIKNPYIFGITTECNEERKNEIFRVDVGASRAFDHGLIRRDCADRICEAHSVVRLPQVLRIDHFNRDFRYDIIDIVRGTVKMARKNIRREEWERQVRGNRDFDLDIPGNYLKKYLKYKTKYMLIKGNEKKIE
jgi:hypothetical protein